jgi:hypothetical protein
MFKITQNTLHYFTFAQVLLMATMNQVEAKQKVRSTTRRKYEGSGQE